jgi:type IV pilus assembly protein PilW
LGVQDVRSYDIAASPDPVGASELNPAGSPALTVDFDLDADGIAERITYLLYDMDNNGTVDLARRDGGGCFTLLAESIEAIGFAYAFDADFDGKVDLDTVNENIIWAVDSDNDNDLDRALDTNSDGEIDLNDTAGGLPLSGAPFNLADVPVQRIRMVRVWLLCRSARRAQKAMLDQSVYVVADQRIGPLNDDFRRRMLEMSIRIRNL